MAGRLPSSLASIRTRIAIGALVLLGACGSDDGAGAGLSEEEYLREGNAICADLEARAAEMGEEFTAEVEASGGELPANERLQELYGVLLDDFEAAFTELGELDGPDDLESDVEEVVGELDDQLGDVRGQIDEDFEAFLEQEDDPFGDAAPRLAALGLDDCGET